MENQKDFAGSSGFIWWMGFIEDRKDPLKLGRLKVRCVGWHADNKLQVPTDKLPWAQVAFPANNTNTYAPKEGDMVFGFFMDGESAQDPVVIGVFNGIPLKKANAQSAYNDPRRGGDLSSAPRPPKSKKLTNKNYWRVRVGDYRIVYEIKDKNLIIVVIRIANRSDVCRCRRGPFHSSNPFPNPGKIQLAVGLEGIWSEQPLLRQ